MTGVKGTECSLCGMSINSDLKWFLSIFFRGHEVIYLILGGVYSVSSFLYKETLPALPNREGRGCFHRQLSVCVGAGRSNTFWPHSLPQPPGHQETPRQVGWGCIHSRNPFQVTTEGEVCLLQGPTVSL